MRGQCNAAPDECCDDLPLRSNVSDDTICQQSPGGRPNYRMDSVPYAVNPRYFIGDKLNDVQEGCSDDDGHCCNDSESSRKMNHSQTMHYSQRQDRRICIQSCCEGNAQDRTE